MSNSLSVLRVTLVESFKELLACLDTFCAMVRHDALLPVWVSRNEMELQENLDMRSKAIQLYRALWYAEDQDGRETLTCAGIVGAGTKTLETAHRCNNAKDAFKSAVLALKTLERSEATAALADLQHRQESVAAAMRHMGAARLNLKQAYRHIPLLDKRPLKIGFTWSRQGRVIQRTSVAAARRLLEQRTETPQTLLELKRLAEIPDDEILARVRSVCPHLRANIVSAAPEGLGIQRRLMQTPLPVLIPLQPGEHLPDFVPVTPEPLDIPRLRRADVRIEDESFLPSVRIHRYRSSVDGIKTSI
ncbi:MAG TPA: hypothetical protein P5149_07680 [Candidatus Competibacteraceae bacterium]|nr:hypothetical protein [Candidatus Competibacteraceae bacterium]